MAAIINLPTEVYLQVLSYLFIPEIVSFRLVCKHFNAIVRENLQDVYRGAAILHRYIPSNPPPDTVEEAVEDQQDVFRDRHVTSWSDLCQIRWKIDIAWKRPAFPKESRIHAGPGASFLRICHDDPYLLVPREYQGGFDVIHLDETRGSEGGRRIYPQGDLQLSSQGYLIFKMTKRRFDVWRREADWTEPTTVVEALPPKIVVRYFDTFELDGRCVAQKMRGDCLMVVTEQNVLSIFNFDPILIAAAARGGDTSSQPNEVSPTLKTDISLIGTTNNGADSQQEVAYTTSIDFDEECIFHCTTQGFRILSRTTFEQLYIIVDTEWKRAALKKWVKCFTANVFYIPRKPVSISPEGEAEAEAEQLVGEEEEEDLVQIQRGASDSRKSQEWRWDVMSVHVEGGMVVMSFPGGWVVGLPDYRGLLSGERTLHDGLGCWVLDIGSSCTGMVFDGRRIVCTERNRHVIVNLHDTPGRVLTEQTRVVRLERREWIPVGTMQNMILNDWSLCFLAARSDEEISSVTVVKWSFRE